MNLAKLAQNEVKKDEMKEAVAGINEPSCGAWCTCTCIAALVEGNGNFSGYAGMVQVKWGG